MLILFCLEGITTLYLHGMIIHHNFQFRVIKLNQKTKVYQNSQTEEKQFTTEFFTI